MAGPKAATIAGATKVAQKGPLLVREIAIGIALGCVGGALWKMSHLNLRKKAEDLYLTLEKDPSAVIPTE